jgi:predicted negative regulator of RcsB-dependent stress response
MMKNQEGRVWINRILSFVLGGVIVLIIMYVVVISPVRRENENLVKQLDEEMYGAVRLLDEAKVYVENESYDRALRTLNELFEKQPGSNEIVEGRKLYAEIEKKILAKDKEWEAAVGPIRAAWEKARAAELLAKAERDKQLVETSLAETLIAEWENVKDQIREDWEKQ